MYGSRDEYRMTWLSGASDEDASKKLELMGVEYDNLTVAEALNAIFNLISAKDKSDVFFLNADCLYKAQKDEEYRSVLARADLLLPDGIGIRLTTKLFGHEMRENCNGTDLSPRILEKASNIGLSVFFLGGRDGIALKAAKLATKQFPELEVAGVSSGFFESDQEVIKAINIAAPDIVFVAMGVPLQEKWISRNRSLINARLCLGVGAFLDYLSGTLPRAPLWMRRAHLEWFWRIFVDPKRMFKRYIIDGFLFVTYAVKFKIGTWGR